MPNSPTLWVAAGMLWIMDASINVSMEPFRAFVGDNLPADQRTLGFAMQNIMQNFVSGVSLLVERSIKPGDVLLVDGTLIKINKLGCTLFPQIRKKIPLNNPEQQPVRVIFLPLFFTFFCRDFPTKNT